MWGGWGGENDIKLEAFNLKVGSDTSWARGGRYGGQAAGQRAVEAPLQQAVAAAARALFMGGTLDPSPCSALALQSPPWQEERRRGYFDEAGNYVERAEKDEDEVDDAWLQSDEGGWG